MPENETASSEKEYIHTGVDPRTVPGTPQAAAAESLADPAIHEAPFGYVDIEMRKRVNRRKNKGLPCRMGPDFPGCRILIRPWSARHLQIARDAHEAELRRPYGIKLKPDDPLPPEDRIELNRFTALFSIMGLEGKFMVDGEIVKLEFPEPGDSVGLAKHRNFVQRHFLPIFDKKNPETAYETDMDFLQMLMGLNEGLSKVTAQEIDRLGENFELGATEKADLADSNR